MQRHLDPINMSWLISVLLAIFIIYAPNFEEV